MFSLLLAVEGTVVAAIIKIHFHVVLCTWKPETHKPWGCWLCLRSVAAARFASAARQAHLWEAIIMPDASHIDSSGNCPLSFRQAFAFSIVGTFARTIFQNPGVWLASMR